VAHALFVAALVIAWLLPEPPFNLALFVLIALLHSRTWPPPAITCPSRSPAHPAAARSASV
jgi:hypothetical protein